MNRYILLVLFTLSGMCSNAQSVSVEENYVVINTVGMRGNFANRTLPDPDFWEIGTDATTVKRHVPSNSSTGLPNHRLSRKFRISPDDVPATPTSDVSAGGRWSDFAGWTEGVNNTHTTTVIDVVPQSSGCVAYKGRSGTETGWRLPTQRELMLIAVLYDQVIKKGGTSITPFTENIYVSCTELNRIESSTLYYTFTGVSWIKTPTTGNHYLTPLYYYKASDGKGYNQMQYFRARCIKDL